MCAKTHVFIIRMHNYRHVGRMQGRMQPKGTATMKMNNA